MPELRPFRALRYAAAAGDPGVLLAPPYDVIGPAEADELRARSPHNAVHLVLPEGPAPDRYALAARRLREWIELGILAEDPEPAVYVYRQAFEREGRERARWALLSALSLAPLGTGGVLPHEGTHAGPKKDRLALTLACSAQLSAVFLTAADPDGRLLDAVRGAGSGDPVLEGRTPDGVGHAVWRATDDRAAGLCRAAAGSPLLIADGHHRYETALEVRRRLPATETAGAVLACVASEADPGLEVFPTHRALAAPPPRGGWLEALEVVFEAEPLPGPDAAGAPAEGAAPPPAARAAAARGDLVALAPSLAAAHLLRPRPEALETAGLGEEDALIPSLAFDRLVLRRTLGVEAEEATTRGFLSYHREPAEAVAAAGAAGCAFLLPPVAIVDVRRAAAAGRTLPPKSTYFAPKVPSGLLFRRL